MNDGPLEDNLDPPRQMTIEEMQASLERGLADVRAGRTIDGETGLQELRLIADQALARLAARGKTVG